MLVMAGSRYLAVTRRDSDLIGLPGGKVDSGENELEAIAREVEEEVGLLLDPALFKPVFKMVCRGDVDYETTGFTYPDLSIDEISSIVPEEGLAVRFVMKEALCDPRSTPFAEYNAKLFEAVEEITQ